MYIAIDCKLGSGCEIQDTAFRMSKFMIRLKLVKTGTEETVDSISENENGQLHGTKVLLRLILPCASSDHILCSDSYISPVGAAETLKQIGLRFIGVVKIATKQYPTK